MKKIYSKMTKERAHNYQIETCIYLCEDGTKLVQKRALNAQAEIHINKMLEYYEINESKGLLVPTRKIKSGCAEFEFVKGKTLYEKIIEAAEQKNIEALKNVLDQYKEILVRMYPESNFLKEEKNVNVDITFDNIVITREKANVIDFEWIFDDVYTVGFGIYRAVTALYARDGHLINEIMTQDEMFNYFGIADHKDLYEKQNQEFNQQIFGKISYNKILCAYQKDNFDISDIISNSDTFTQIYFDCGEGYSEEKSIRYEIRKNQIDLKIPIMDEIRGVRVDLCNFPFVAKNIKIYEIAGTNENEITNYKHNSIVMEKQEYWFWDGDPQIILESDIVDFDKNNAIRIYVEKIDIVKDQDALKVSKLLGEQITKKIQKKNEESARAMEETIQNHQRDLEQHRAVIDDTNMQLRKCSSELAFKEKMCERYRSLADALIARLNEVNAEYKISEYKNNI